MGQIITEKVLEWPGVLLRWLWFGRKKKLVDYLDDGTPYNYILSFLLIVSITLWIVWLN